MNTLAISHTEPAPRRSLPTPTCFWCDGPTFLVERVEQPSIVCSSCAWAHNLEAYEATVVG